MQYFPYPLLRRLWGIGHNEASIVHKSNEVLQTEKYSTDLKTNSCHWPSLWQFKNKIFFCPVLGPIIIRKTVSISSEGNFSLFYLL